MKTYLLLGSAFLALSAVPALAQPVEERTVVVEEHKGGAAAGAVGGAVAGAVVAGPVGLVVGAVVGATIGHAAAPPTEVRTYVTGQTVVSTRYGGRETIVVGKTVDGDIIWREVPAQPRYRWAYLNDQRVVIDNDTRTVVAIY